MRILDRQNVTRALTDNYITQEASSISMLTTNPIILVDFYNINTSQSAVTDGFKIHDSNILNPESKVVFDKIENIPLGGVSELNFESMYDEDEQGFGVDFSSNAFTFPNTVKPVEGSFFVIKSRSGDGRKTMLFRISDIESNYVRNMSITSFNFSLAHTDKDFYDMLEAQTYRRFVCLSSQMGPESSLVVEKESIVTLEEKIDDYLYLTEEYKNAFLSESGVFLYELVNVMEGDPIYFYDRVFNKFLATNKIIFFDPIVSFAKKQFAKPNRPLIMEFDAGISDDTLNKNILTALLNRKFPKGVQLYPIAKRMAAQLAKYQKERLIHVDNYSSDTVQRTFEFIDYMGKGTSLPVYMDIFDDEFIQRIKKNRPYGQPLEDPIVEEPIDEDPVEPPVEDDELDPEDPIEDDTEDPVEPDEGDEDEDEELDPEEPEEDLVEEENEEEDNESESEENEDEYINKELRNIIIALFNLKDISKLKYAELDVNFDRSEDSFYLIPVLMWFLQKYLIQSIER